MAGVAELAVHHWLNADGDTAGRLDGLFVSTPPLGDGGGGDATADTTATVAARVVGEGYWAVTVAAAITAAEAPPDTAEAPPDVDVGTAASKDIAPTLWYVEVGVLETSGAPVVVATPAVVPAPVGTDSAEPIGPSLSVAHGDDPVTATAGAFLAALLAGGGDVARYLAPGVEIAAVTPAPFVTVTVDRAAATELDPATTRTRLEVTAETADGAGHVLGYELVLALRADRWEVVSVSGAPTLAPAAPPGPTDPTAAPSPSSPVTAPATTTTLASTPGA